MNRILGTIAVALVLTLSGCGRGSKQDVMNKVKNGMAKEEVEKALGKADEYSAVDVPLMGKNETLKYKVSDGIVIVNVQGGKVLAVVTDEQKSK